MHLATTIAFIGGMAATTGALIIGVNRRPIPSPPGLPTVARLWRRWEPPAFEGKAVGLGHEGAGLGDLRAEWDPDAVASPGKDAGRPARTGSGAPD